MLHALLNRCPSVVDVDGDEETLPAFEAVEPVTNTPPLPALANIMLGQAKVQMWQADRCAQNQHHTPEQRAFLTAEHLRKARAALDNAIAFLEGS